MTTSSEKHDHVFGFLMVLAAVAVCALLAGCGSNELADDDDVATIETAPEPAPSVERLVRDGDSLWTIAVTEEVDWLQLAAVNRPYLVAKYEERCTQLLARYRGRNKRGWYCNDRRADT